MRMNPRICVHSETMLPTTWPHLQLGSMALNATTQAMPVTRRNKVSECCAGILLLPTALCPLVACSRQTPFHRDAWLSLLL